MILSKMADEVTRGRRMVEYIVISKKTKVEPLMDCFSDVFTTFRYLDTFQLRCCLREGQIALGFHQKTS